jgi:hypothetical protein
MFRAEAQGTRLTRLQAWVVSVVQAGPIPTPLTLLVVENLYHAIRLLAELDIAARLQG